MNYKKKYSELCRVIQENIPGFEVRYKRESPLMWVIAVLVWPFCPTFMKSFTTTVYPRVYFPERGFEERDPETAFRVLAHEYQHLWDFKSGRLSASLRYLAPQIYALPALLAVGAVWSPWFLLSLVFLVALLPWPSPGRAAIERAGYAMSIATWAWMTRLPVPDYYKEHVAAEFTGWNYYRMWPDEEEVLDWIDRVEDAIGEKEALALMDPTYSQVLAIIRSKE
jgi:hypothetical protein